jgi:hypothetical protein
MKTQPMTAQDSEGLAGAEDFASGAAAEIADRAHFTAVMDRNGISVLVPEIGGTAFAGDEELVEWRLVLAGQTEALIRLVMAGLTEVEHVSPAGLRALGFQRFRR